MKTAKEFLVRDELFKTPLTEEEKHYYIDRIITYDDYIKAMIEFAKMHVEETLKQALESIPCLGSSTDIANYEEVEEAVLNSYPLENII